MKATCPGCLTNSPMFYIGCQTCFERALKDSGLPEELIRPLLLKDTPERDRPLTDEDHNELP